MHPVRSAVCTALIFSLLTATARADVIGAAAPKPKPKETRAVEKQMEAVGVDAAEARALTARLSAEDLDYFAAHPQRVQFVGRQEVQNMWYESVFGGAFLVAMTALAIGIVVHNRDT